MSMQDENFYAPEALPNAQQAAPAEPEMTGEDRKALVKKLIANIKAAKKHHAPAFKRIREDMDFAYKYGVGKQWPGQTEDSDQYIANIVQRHINTRVAALYAKNPTVVAKRAPRLDFALWDGNPDSAAGAQMAVQMAVQQMLPPPPEAVELLQDIADGSARRSQTERTGKTLEILFRHAMKEQQPDFKTSIKQLIRRTQTCGVGYVRLGYQRLMARRPADQAEIADITVKLQHIEGMQKRQNAETAQTEGDLSAEREKLKLALNELMKKPEVLLREGLTFQFPRALNIIVDPACTNLVGFIGAGWVAEEFSYTPKEIQDTWGKDVTKKFTRTKTKDGDNEYNPAAAASDGKDEDRATVWVYYEKNTGLMYTLCDGCDEFLEEPAGPPIELERFFPIYTLAFNGVESETEVYPPSDVRLLRFIQMEYNRLKESQRQHRIANRPLYATPAGAFEESDTEEGTGNPSLANYEAHDVIVLNGLKEGESISNKLQPVPKIPVDPNLYESASTFTDMQRVVGSQEANLGGTSNASATESSIAESSRLSTLSSNVDDLDDLLSALARDGGITLLLHMNRQTVIEIAGPGASWPQLSRAQVAKEIFLDIEAGSSGRPNKAQEIANFERAAPFLLQIPGISPNFLGRYLLTILDAKLDMTDAFIEGLPSIMAMNRQTQLSTGDPATDPNQQGGEGGGNAPGAQQNETAMGSQPAYPTNNI